MNPLSVVIITFNEEKNIRRCLESVQALADEIIVVDSFSTDATASICAEFGVRFVQQQWLGFSEQKNFANSLATYDWIFSIDADETLSDELQQSILQIKRNELGNNAFAMNRLLNYCGKWIHHSGWYPDRKVRIFRKDSVRWDGTIHEVLVYNQPTTITLLQGDLLHYSYHSISDHMQQVNKFTNLTAEVAFTKGKTVSKVGVWLRPIWRFCRDYFFKLGFLDGYYGWMVCRISAFTTFLKYTKLREMNKNSQKKRRP